MTTKIENKPNLEYEYTLAEDAIDLLFSKVNQNAEAVLEHLLALKVIVDSMVECLDGFLKDGN